MNPMEIMSLLMNNGKNMNSISGSIINEVAKKVIGTMYQETNADAELKKVLFVKDARPSEKITALQTLVEKSLGSVLKKLNENDVNMLYNTLQSYKD
jgi:hypothetical protein